MKINKKLLDNKWRYEYRLELIIQSLEWDSEYWNYLVELKSRLKNKGFLYPSEYKVIDSWKYSHK